ncbi:MAG: methyl-accepting chemotaxis protein [Desulfamplus sp.]|nr:methyl-accepting chemotaxis protein [Desulfamplus sp.]
MRIRDISLRLQVLTICTILVAVPLLILAFVSYYNVKQETISQLEKNLKSQASVCRVMAETAYTISLEQVKSSLSAARVAIVAGINTERKIVIDSNKMHKISITNQIDKSTKEIEIPSFQINDEIIYSNFRYVDKVKSLTELSVTIFQLIPDGLLRISTNVLKEDGSRAMNTYIPKDSPVYKSIIDGQTYYGRAFVVKEWFISGYEPIKDIDGKIVGALFVGFPEKNVVNMLIEQFAKIVTGETGYVYVLNSKGDYILSYKRARDGENIWGAKDSDGRFFIQDMISSAKKLSPEDSTITYYPWKNKDEKRARMKIAGYAYLSQLDWVIGYSAYQEEFFGGVNSIRYLAIIIVVISLITGLVIAIVFSGSIAKRIGNVITIVEAIGDGNLTSKIETDNIGTNELGRINQALASMSLKLQNLIRQISGNAETLGKASNELAKSSTHLFTSTEEVSKQSNTIAAAAEELSSNMASVVLVSEQASSNISMVASAAEEMTATIGEIAQSTSNTRNLSNNAVKKVLSSSERINQLGNSAQEIGIVIETIAEISDQTNLLALNATIEAARAGEAGKGFAVVASEIKELAKQTSVASQSIKEKIEAIQSSTTHTVSEIKEISKVINDVDDMISTIATAVEEQSATTKEIASNVADASHAIQNVSDNITQSAAVVNDIAGGISGSNRAVNQISNSSSQVNKKADELKLLSERLKDAVDKFKV